MEKKNFKVKFEEFKEKHPKLVSVTKKVAGVLLLGGTAGLIGYSIGKAGVCPTDLSDGCGETWGVEDSYLDEPEKETNSETDCVSD